MLSIKTLKRLSLESTAFELKAGQATVVTGRSGSGKSLLLRAIADLDPNDSSMDLNGKPRSSHSPIEWRQRVMYVAAESGWWDESVAPHFANPSAAAGLFGAVGLPCDSLDWKVRRLSSGEKQRLALIRALVLKPDVLLLDEPMSALDQLTAQKVEMVLHGFLSGGGSILIVTHSAEQAEQFGPGRLHIVDGRVQEDLS